MEEFEKQVLQRLARIERAVEILLTRLSNLEQNYTQADGKIWEQLRLLKTEIYETCDEKRKTIHESMQDKNDRLESNIKEDITFLEQKVQDFEQKVFAVEKGVTAGETTTRDVVSIQGKIENLSSCLNQTKVSLSVLDTNQKNDSLRLKNLEDKVESRGKNWQSTIISLLAVLLTAGMLFFTVLREIFTRGT